MAIAIFSYGRGFLIVKTMSQKEKSEIRLTPSAVLYREKLRLRKRTDLPDGLIPLPGFRYEATATKPDMEKTFVKGMIQLLASATKRASGPAGGDVQFVTLVELSLDKPRLAFEFDCPNPALPAYVKKQLSAKETATEGLSILGQTPIEYQMVIPPNQRVPVVVHYQAQKDNILFINRNHMTNAEQFLDPNLCRTTSGFLNFIGALLLLQAEGQAGGHIKRMLNQVDNFLDHGLDEWLRWLFYLAETRTLYEADRILVDREHPEHYFFDASPKIAGAGGSPRAS
jgi:hypothetical protein